MTDPYAERRARNSDAFARRNAELAARREQVAADLGELRFTLDPTAGLPSCDLCGCLTAPSRVRLHRTRCTEET